METLIIRSRSQKAIRLIQELSREIEAESKKPTTREIEDLYPGQSVKKGLRSGNSNRGKTIK